MGKEFDNIQKPKHYSKLLVQSSLNLWVKDMWSAIWALGTVWFITDKEKLQRKKLFVETGIDEARQKQFPLRLWKWCYNKQIRNLRNQT